MRRSPRSHRTGQSGPWPQPCRGSVTLPAGRTPARPASTTAHGRTPPSPVHALVAELLSRERISADREGVTGAARRTPNGISPASPAWRAASCARDNSGKGSHGRRPAPTRCAAPSAHACPRSNETFLQSNRTRDLILMIDSFEIDAAPGPLPSSTRISRTGLDQASLCPGMRDGLRPGTWGEGREPVPARQKASRRPATPLRL